MTQQTINVGAAPNDGTGDPARTAFTKSNDNFTELYARGGGTVTAPQGRLSLATATPVMNTSQTGKTTIFYTPYVGNLCPLYDGSALTMTTFSEISVATTDTTKNPAAIGASKNNDWFIWSDAGTLRLTHGPDWTDSATRSAGTALTRVNGIWLNNASITNGPAASRGTYVGTTRSGGSSNLNWGLAGVNTDGLLNVWNAYNRVDVATMETDNFNTWTYTTATWRQAHSGIVLMQVAYVCGLAEDGCNASYSAVGANNGGARISCGVGVDSSTTPSGSTGNASSAANQSMIATVSISPVLGVRTIYAMEWSTATGTTTWAGAGAAGDIQNGLHFRGRF